MSNKKAFIVIGLGYGDEGKGLTTDYLCYHSDTPIVIRFNGGHQAGHTVHTKSGKQHVFSTFGSGTLRGTPSYFSKYCTFSPAYFLEEYNRLPVKPMFFVDKLCPVTTHYDVLYNRAIENKRGQFKYGTCGVGFGATIDRDKANAKLQVNELFSPVILREKLALIKRYYREKINSETDFNFDGFEHDLEDSKLERYIEEISKLISLNILHLVNEEDIFRDIQPWNTYIFEGAQGILLDKDFGNRPYITKSNTTSKNAIEMLDRNFANQQIDKAIFYVTRAYLTRHGEGPFQQMTPTLRLKNNGNETNVSNQYQGDFKTSYLNIDLLNYALHCDFKFSKNIKKNLVVTCLDQLVTKELYVIKDGDLKQIAYNQLSNLLNCKFDNCKFSFSNCAEDL